MRPFATLTHSGAHRFAVPPRCRITPPCVPSANPRRVPPKRPPNPPAWGAGSGKSAARPSHAALPSADPEQSSGTLSFPPDYLAEVALARIKLPGKVARGR